MEMEADPCVCGIKRKASSTDLTLSQGKAGAGRELGKEQADEVQRSWGSYITAPRDASEGMVGRPSAVWRCLPEEEGLGLPGKPSAYLPYRPPARDCSADVVEYIVKELQGISRIQTEIAELQQHLTLIKGSVDEVSSCVDSVLSEIEGLQGGGGSSTGRASAAPKARGLSRPEPPCSQGPLLSFYGVPEQEGENTKELICRLLSESHCFNGIHHSQYVQEAYRANISAGPPRGPRPAVVRLADLGQRDIILQKSFLLQSLGVTVAAGAGQGLPNGQASGPEGWGDTLPSPDQGPTPWDSGPLHGEVVRTEGDGQFQLDSSQGQHEKAGQEGHGGEETRSPLCKATKVGEGCLRTEGNEPAAGARQRTGQKEHPRPASPSFVGHPCASPEQPEGCGPSGCSRGSRSSAEGVNAPVGQELPLPEAGSASARREAGFLVGEDQPGELTPGESETDGDASTLEFLSPEQGSLVEEGPPVPPPRPPGCDSAALKLVGSSETLKDMIQMDLNEQDPTEHVFRDVLENSQYFLEHSRQSLDLVDMRFYTNKLGKALTHFRSALQVVFHRLETGDPEVLLGGEKSFPVADEPSPTLSSTSPRSLLEKVAESPPSRSSESLANGALSVDPAVGQGVPPAESPSLGEAPTPLPQPLPDPAGRGTPEPPSSGPGQPDGCPPLSLEKVCAETIYLNKCIRNFKQVLREKRQMRRRLLKELAPPEEEEEAPPGTRLVAHGLSLCA